MAVLTAYVLPGRIGVCQTLSKQNLSKIDTLAEYVCDVLVFPAEN